MSNPIKQKCIVCDGYIEWKESDSRVVWHVPLYAMYFELMMWQKLIPSLPAKLHKGVNSLCQELETFEKKIDPLRRELITTLYQKFTQKRDKNDESSVGSFVNRKQEIFNLCENCFQALEPRTKSIARELYEHLEKFATEK